MYRNTGNGICWRAQHNTRFSVDAGLVEFPGIFSRGVPIFWASTTVSTFPLRLPWVSSATRILGLYTDL